jgi:hypothetical protein
MVSILGHMNEYSYEFYVKITSFILFILKIFIVMIELDKLDRAIKHEFIFNKNYLFENKG